MKPILFVGDSHLARLERAYPKSGSVGAAFLCTPGPIADLVGFSDGNLFLQEDRELLKKRRNSGQHDFQGWLDLALQRFNGIAETTGTAISDYSAVVIVGYHLFHPEMWAGAALAYTRGEISRRVCDKHIARHFVFTRSVKTLAQHANILDQATQISGRPPVYSVATPARSAESAFPNNLLKAGETGHQAFRLAEARYADLLREKYGAVLIPYPDSLLADDGISTAVNFQHSKGDYFHVGFVGSQIWMDSILAHLQPTRQRQSLSAS